MEPMEDASSYEKRLLQTAKDRKIPVSGTLELLPLCNMNCEMCYVRLSKEEMEKRGRIRTKEEWLQLAKEMQQAGTIFVLLTGGEPLMHPEFKEIYLGLKKLGMIVSINTNGTLINEAWANFFAQNPPRRINITLYGVSEETYERLCHYKGGFENVIQAVRLLRSRQIDVRLGTSVTRYNKQDLERVFEIAREEDTAIIADTYMVAATREREQDFAYGSRLDAEEAAGYRIRVLRKMMGEEFFREYVHRKVFEVDNILPEEEAEYVNCYAGNCAFAINWLGRMQPCVTMNLPSVDVFENGFIESWEMLQKEVAMIRTAEECKSCKLRPICKNCAGNALVETGSYDGVSSYICRYSKENYRLFKAIDQDYRVEG